MPKQVENICLVVCAALVGMLLLQFIPSNTDYILDSAAVEVQSSEPVSSHDSTASISGFRAEVLEFGKDNSDCLTIVRDLDGKPLLRIDNAIPKGWSPAQDMLLLQNVGKEGGYFIRDLSGFTGWKKFETAENTSLTFGKSEVNAAVFSKDGGYVLLEGSDGIARTLSVMDLLQSRQKTLTAAAWDEDESNLPDLLFDQ